MAGRTEELIVLLSEKEKDFIIKSAADKYLSIEDFIILSALALGAPSNISKKSLNSMTSQL